jgi:predicted membrane-bound spermidine synthase
LSERWGLFVLALPWLVYGIRRRLSSHVQGTPRRFRVRAASYLLLPVVLGFVVLSPGYEEQYPDPIVFRDPTATVIASGTGMKKRLLVNGVGITLLSPITKMMAHLPLAFLDRPPESALVVCFGMGTTFRSLLSWNIPVTAVELVPSVPRLFGYYHADGADLLRSPLAHVVIDDGRRYLERTSQQYDVITIDPPPPVEAAGSSLLYSEEFYSVVKRRLRPGGILQQWLPAGDAVDVASVSRALRESFPYVRVFPSVENWGVHFLASELPLPPRTAADMAHFMPARAAADMMEWGPQSDAEHQFAVVLNREIPIDKLIAAAPRAPALRDDRPMNEYFILRRGSEQNYLQNLISRK